MLGFFTDPYPDELFYSAYARYHARARNRKVSTTMNSLFGSPFAAMVIDFPARLNYFVSQLPGEHVYTVDKIIKENTLFPFYAPFITARCSALTKRAMVEYGKGGEIHNRLGILTSKIVLNTLRFCPSCVVEDRRKYGETYWHRLHQLPGVIICPEHNEMLEESGFHPKRFGLNNELLAAEQVIKGVPERKISESSERHQILLHISRGAKWILEQRNLTSEVTSVVQRFRYLVFQHGLGTYNGTIQITKIIELINRIIPDDVLSMFNCNFTKGDSWIKRLFNSPNTAQSPVRYLLLMTAFNILPEDFFKLPTEIEPFGRSPFPCLNRASIHYKEKIVTHYKIFRRQKSKNDVSGDFTCRECGFVYRRHGRDEKGERYYEYNLVLKYGTVWDEELKKLFTEEKLSLTDIAERLGLSVHVLTRQIARLNLATGRNYKKPKLYGKNETYLMKIMEEKSAKREEWINARKKHPDYPRTKIQMAFNNLYVWLNKYDKEWLYQNMPPRNEIPRGRAARYQKSVG